MAENRHDWAKTKTSVVRDKKDEEIILLMVAVCRVLCDVVCDEEMTVWVTFVLSGVSARCIRRAVASDEVPPVIAVHPTKELAYKSQDLVLLECEATGSPHPM